MAQFWCVCNKYFDSGRIKTNVFQVEAESKPENACVENRMCDEYRDYFDTYEEARAFAEETKNA